MRIDWKHLVRDTFIVALPAFLSDWLIGLHTLKPDPDLLNLMHLLAIYLSATVVGWLYRSNGHKSQDAPDLVFVWKQFMAYSLALSVTVSIAFFFLNGIPHSRKLSRLADDIPLFLQVAFPLLFIGLVFSKLIPFMWIGSALRKKYA